MKKLLFFLILPLSICAQNDSLMLRKIHDVALTEGRAYEDLRSLCKDVGARISGSLAADMAVVWGEQKLKSYGFDKVYKQPIKVPHWERGTTEKGYVQVSNGEMRQLSVLALGGSVATEGTLSAELIRFETIDDLKAAKEADVKGKVVYLAQPMDQKFIRTFRAYGACYPIRGNGASEAGRLGAVGVVIRSLAIPEDDHPHTGSMRYADDVKKIPAAALSTNDAVWLDQRFAKKQSMKIHLELSCMNYPDKDSYNVIAEITGTENPEEIIVFGGHLDSWDVGEGAHDDGAGVVHSMEALRILKAAGYKPKHTLRVVMFMNEENGNMGGKTFAKWVHEKDEKIIAAVESDRGGFAPRGFDVDGSDAHFDMLQSFASDFHPYDLFQFQKGFGGVDISPLKEFYPEIPLFGFAPDSQRYFDFHHAETDVFESVNKRELELGAAAVASLVYLLDQRM